VEFVQQAGEDRQPRAKAAVPSRNLAMGLPRGLHWQREAKGTADGASDSTYHAGVSAAGQAQDTGGIVESLEVGMRIVRPRAMQEWRSDSIEIDPRTHGKARRVRSGRGKCLGDDGRLPRAGRCGGEAFAQVAQHRC